MNQACAKTGKPASRKIGIFPEPTPTMAMPYRYPAGSHAKFKAKRRPNFLNLRSQVVLYTLCRKAPSILTIQPELCPLLCNQSPPPHHSDEETVTDTTVVPSLRRVSLAINAAEATPLFPSFNLSPSADDWSPRSLDRLSVIQKRAITPQQMT